MLTSRSTISGAYLTGQIVGRVLVIVPSVRDAGVAIASVTIAIIVVIADATSAHRGVSVSAVMI